MHITLCLMASIVDVGSRVHKGRNGMSMKECLVLGWVPGNQKKKLKDDRLQIKVTVQSHIK